MNELKERTFASILELDTKSKIEIYRILKRHASDEETIEWYDQVLTRLKKQPKPYPCLKREFHPLSAITNPSWISF